MLQRLAYHPHGDFFATNSGVGGARIWDMRSGRLGELHRFLSFLPTESVADPSIVFAPDGYTLATTHGNHQLNLWDVRSGERLHTLYSPGAALEWLTWSPDGQTLASCDESGAIYLWEMDAAPSGQLRHTLESHTYLWDLAFSPDSHWLASVGDDRLIRLWNVASGECLQTLSADNHNGSSLAFLPNGAMLVSGGFDGTIRFWHVGTGELVTTLHLPGPYAGMQIRGVTGISEAQKAALRALGAVEG